MNIQRRFSALFVAVFAGALLVALIAPFATRSMSASAANYYVSSTGNDTNDGRSAGAFQRCPARGFEPSGARSTWSKAAMSGSGSSL